jgi:hypothetical protein
MTERLDQYQQWYDRKSIGAKSRYMTIRAASVVGAAIVPVIVNIKLPYVEASHIATIISLGVVIVVSLESVYHFGDQWRNYRITEQFLMREKLLFRTGDGPYRGLDKDSAFLAFGRALRSANFCRKFGYSQSPGCRRAATGG